MKSVLKQTWGTCLETARRGTWGFAVLQCWCSFDAVMRWIRSQFAVISNLTECDRDGVSSTFLAVMRCSLIFFAVLRCSGPPPMSPSAGEMRRRINFTIWPSSFSLRLCVLQIWPTTRVTHSIIASILTFNIRYDVYCIRSRLDCVTCTWFYILSKSVRLSFYIGSKNINSQMLCFPEKRSKKQRKAINIICIFYESSKSKPFVK